MAAHGHNELELVWTAIARLSLSLAGKHRGSVEKKLYHKGQYPQLILKRVKRNDSQHHGLYRLAPLELRAIWAYSQLVHEMCIQPLLGLDENKLMLLYDIQMFDGSTAAAISKMEEDMAALVTVRDKSRLLPRIGKIVLFDVAGSVTTTLKGGLTHGMSGTSGIASGRLVLDKLTLQCKRNTENIDKILPRFKNSLGALKKW